MCFVVLCLIYYESHTYACEDGSDCMHSFGFMQALGFVIICHQSVGMLQHLVISWKD